MPSTRRSARLQAPKKRKSDIQVDEITSSTNGAKKENESDSEPEVWSSAAITEEEVKEESSEEVQESDSDDEIEINNGEEVTGDSPESIADEDVGNNEQEKVESDIAESDDDAPPEEVTFSKSKQAYDEFATVMKNKKTKLKSLQLSEKVLRAVNNSLIKPVEDEEPTVRDCDADTEDSDDDDYNKPVVRIIPVALTTLHTELPAVAPVVNIVKKGKWNKTKIGPAANFLVKRHKT